MNKNNDDRIITVQTFNDLNEANIIMNKLKDNGIESFVEDENVVGLNPLGGVELKVFMKDINRAREIMSN